MKTSNRPVYRGSLHRVDWNDPDVVRHVARSLHAVIGQVPGRPNTNIFPDSASARRHGAVILESFESQS